MAGLSRQERNNFLRNACGSVERSRLDAFLLTEKHDIAYLTGFFSEGAALLLAPNAKPIYFIDRMNDGLAEKMLKKIGVRILPGVISDEIIGELNKTRYRRVGIDADNMVLSLHDKLIKNIKKAGIKPAVSIIRDMREIKTVNEIVLLKKAARTTVKIWNTVKKEIRPGITEKAAAGMIDTLIHKNGCPNSFSTIAAFGRNTAYPHAVPTLASLKEGEHGVFDFGLRFTGYSSDLTRVWVKGRINRKILELQKEVIALHDRAIKMVKPGFPIARLAEYADKFFIDKGLGKYIKHGLGHGVGLDIHERPFLRIKSDKVFKEGMVLTIEPGLYAAGLGGIREEDMILVTKKGCEVLTQ